MGDVGRPASYSVHITLQEMSRDLNCVAAIAAAMLYAILCAHRSGTPGYRQCNSLTPKPLGTARETGAYITPTCGPTSAAARINLSEKVVALYRQRSCQIR